MESQLLELHGMPLRVVQEGHDVRLYLCPMQECWVAMSNGNSQTVTRDSVIGEYNEVFNHPVQKG